MSYQTRFAVHFLLCVFMSIESVLCCLGMGSGAVMHHDSCVDFGAI